MDIVERLRSENCMFGYYESPEIQIEAANEIERLRETLKIFANNVKETNVGIDKNWAKTVYALKAENQRLQEALKELATSTYHSVDDYKDRAREALEGK
jgi:glutamate formiminotransferase